LKKKVNDLEENVDEFRLFKEKYNDLFDELEDYKNKSQRDKKDVEELLTDFNDVKDKLNDC
jgi:uncharacterized coiled-coil DUF342 family protein